MKFTLEGNKKYCTGLLADSPCDEQCGEEEAIGEHYKEQSTSISSKPHKTQSRRKPKPYKVEICPSISKEHSVDDKCGPDGETPTPSHGKCESPRQESVDIAPKKCYTDSSDITESPSGVGIFSFEMPSEYHSNLHQLAVASQLVSQSPSGEVPYSVIGAIEQEQKSQQGHHKSPVNNQENHEKPRSLVLSIPRSPLISISGGKQTTTTSAAQQTVVESSTPSCATVIPSPAIVSNCNGKTPPSLETVVVGSAIPAAQALPGSPDSGESVFIYPTDKVTPQLKRTSPPTIVRVDSAGSDATFSSVTSNEAITKAPEPIVTAASTKPNGRVVHPVIATPVTQSGAFFECPIPVSMVTKPTSIQVCSPVAM